MYNHLYKDCYSFIEQVFIMAVEMGVREIRMSCGLKILASPKVQEKTSFPSSPAHKICTISVILIENMF